MGLRANPTQRQKRLGQELRKLREASDVSTADACAKAGLNKPHLSHIEAGRTACPEPRLRALLSAYGCSDGTLIEALVRMTRATGKGWWTQYGEVLDERARDLAELESATTAFRSFEWLHVPGLLQTPDYMREIFEGRNPGVPSALMERYIDFRLRRQQVLTEKSLPTYHAVIHEAAFHMHFVSRETMLGQLQYLVEAAQFPNVIVQLLPFKAGSYPAIAGAPFTVHEAEAPQLATVYVEQPISPLFLGDGFHIDQFGSDFARMSNVSLAPLNPTEAHQESSFGLVQYLRYVL
jgi:transcriptional regulator with XRE-family HTH domain